MPDEQIPHVSIDHRLAAKDAVLYLLAKGHRRIAFINSDERYLYARQRRDGYRDALRDAGLPERPEYIQIVGGIEHPLGELAARRLLALEQPPSAVFAVSDTLAIGAIKATLAAGLRCPSDLAVVGFDDVPLASIFEPSLTTIAQPRRELGRAGHAAAAASASRANCPPRSRWRTRWWSGARPDRARAAPRACSGRQCLRISKPIRKPMPAATPIARHGLWRTV